MSKYKITKPPRILRSKKTKLDNIALVPASLLPYKRQWQHIANELPPGAILICVPTDEQKPRQQFLAVARDLRAKGFQVRAVRAESLVPHHL